MSAVVAFAFVYAGLLVPDHADRITPAAFARLPLELAAMFAVFAAVRGRAGRWLAIGAGLLVGLALILRIADIGAFQAFARPFNPVLDFHLLGAGMNLLSGAIGRAGALAAAAGAVLAAAIISVVSVWAALRLARLAHALPRRTGAIVAALGLAAWGGLEGGGVEFRPRVGVAALEGGRALVDHAAGVAAGIGDLRAFETVAAVDAFRDVPGDRLLGALRGRDVIVVFIESYGRTVIDDPRYAPPVRALLEAATGRLAASGVSARSGFLASPTVGGMSWLAHGTALSGLWVDNQRRYDSLVVSDRMTLNQAFRKAGWRTVAAMPAISMAWPEGGYFGYDTIYAAPDLGYRGKPFNWVTMPDQYVWSALRALELDRPDRKPVMAEMALISSHAPWTPVPRRIPWDQVGDGRVFDEMATAGDPPDVVWKDPDRVRLQYRLSIEYALDTLVSYSESFDLSNTVILAFGDHQPAPLVTGEGAGIDVPVHLITADPSVIEAVEGWGWTDGMLPAADAPVWRMDSLRDRVLRTFSGAAGS